MVQTGVLGAGDARRSAVPRRGVDRQRLLGAARRRWALHRGAAARPGARRRPPHPTQDRPRCDSEPRGRHGVGAQPQQGTHLRQLAYPGRPGLAGAPRLPGAARLLPRHLRPQQSGARPLRRRARRPQLGAHQLRQGLGTQVLPPGGDGLSLLARGAARALQVIKATTSTTLFPATEHPSRHVGLL